MSSDTSSVADEYGNFHRGILIIPDKETVDVIALEEEKERVLIFNMAGIRCIVILNACILEIITEHSDRQVKVHVVIIG